MTTGQQAKESRDHHQPAMPAPFMRAVVQEAYGSAEMLHEARIPRPSMADNEVLVKVVAAGLDRGTWHVTRGLPYAVRLAYGFRAPRNPVPGLDLAGTVEAVGSKVTRFVVGDQVFGSGKGSFAEFAPARENQLAHKPAGISFEEAAAVPVSACTALMALRAAGIQPNAAGIQPASGGIHSHSGRADKEPKVLITGASGGVGSFAVQLAKAAGAEVTGVASTAKLDLVRVLGADHVIDYTTQDFAGVGGRDAAGGAPRYDVIIDIAGNPSVSRLRRALTPSGTAVITGGEEGGSWTGSLDRQLRAVMLSPFIKQRLTMILGAQSAADLEYLAGLLDAGTIAPAIDRTYPLVQVPEAMRYFDGGKARGKVVITI
ncbi:NAD(P)-dependent alcohol dehydrogenase [Paenarthrobacter aurescens]|uniref:NADPH:quinone reductase n=1 Tax=Paenarthrobacter aurescens TaxID=43663 RepID=A0A4Y3NCW8_PAEAU|nr:NAD(P)-dependent alcohol dehydrogenase [Paenarthrobacter aurescens]MDO6160479.1 NAD(P)-dependent alcohol dehydrogenase [Paenarthrobacter aurescens]GEB19542.1 NADPH:quinone reductase [Paenarthrobacter aurescens]